MKASSSDSAPRRAISAAGRVADQHAAGVHQRDAVAALASFMKWVEMKMVTPSLRERSISSARNRRAPPDRRRRSARRGSAFRAVDHRHRQRQALAHAQRQRLGQRVDGGQVEAFDHLLHAAGIAPQATWNRRACSTRFCAPSVRRRARRTGTCSRRGGAFRGRGGRLLSEQPGLAFAGPAAGR
jgi:hypothetical protein